MLRVSTTSVCPTATTANFPGGTTGIAYPIALAEALANTNFNDGDPEIRARFNSLVDSDPDCLGGGGFYYGLDGQIPIGMSNLFSTVLHELGHGLGFISVSDAGPDGSGAFVGAGGFPDAFSANLTDLEIGKGWPDMSNSERKASAINEPDLVWGGPNVTTERSLYLGRAPDLVINMPEAIAGTHEVLLGDEPTIVVPDSGVTAEVVNGNNFGDGCTQINQSAFFGRIVLFDKAPDCSAAVPAFFSQFATGAVGVIIAATSGSGFPDMGGQISNQEVTIPYVGVTKAVADSIRANIGLANVTIKLNATRLNGENQGRVKMHAPTEFDSSASLAHWSKSASPNLLMEPTLGNLDPDNVDLTTAAFKDMGWGTTGGPPFVINAGLNDAWVSADAPLQGFFFTVYPDLGFFFLSWFTFDSVPPGADTATFGASDTRWVTGGAFYSGDTVTIPVELTSGGIFNGSDPTAAQTPNYGTITIKFINCNLAELSYSFPSLGLSGMTTLTRALADNVPICQGLQLEAADPTKMAALPGLALSAEATSAVTLPRLQAGGSAGAELSPALTPINSGMNDAWVSAEAPFQGLFFTVFPNQGVFFLSWFTFDSAVPVSGTATFGAEDHRWVTGAGFYSGNSVTIPVELTTGGIFNGSDPTASQTSNYGTITLTFNSCNEAVMSYDFPTVGLSGMTTLTRALPDNVALCEAMATR